MITLDLVEYIKSQLNKNVSKDLIVSQLSQVGWRIEDIEEGFSSVESSIEENIPTLNTLSENLVDNFSSDKIEETKEESNQEIQPVFDKYRELPEELESQYLKNKAQEEKKEPSSTLELLKIWVPSTIKPKEVIKTPEVKPSPQDNPSFIELSKLELPKQEDKKEDLNPVINKTPIFSIPEIKINEASNRMFVPEESVSNVSNTNNNQIISIPEIKINTGEEKILAPEIKTTILDVPIKPVFSKTIIDSISPLQKVQSIQTLIPVKPIISQSNISDISPNNAMISSYPQAILASNKESESVQPKKINIFLKLGIAILVISIISGMIFAFVEGYLKLPGSDLSLSIVKKDPKVVMLNTFSTFSNYKSYKSETNISITSPSLSNITTGLSSGEVVTSKDRDSISVNIKSLENTKDGKVNTDYIFDFNSSLLKNDIVSDWKYDGTNLYVSIPDLKQIFDKDAPAPAVVSMDPNQLGMIANELSSPIQEIIKKIDIYNILSNDIPLYVKNELASISKEFIGTLEYREMESEFIHGVDTYHYEMTASRPATKKMLGDLAELLIAQLPPDQKSNMDEAIGASDINSFEVWVGKNDQNLYQFKLTLNVPLSKVLGLNDSGIAGNEVKLDWMTTFYDIDVENNITMPTDTIKVEDFVKNIKDTKIRNIISVFKPEATLLKNAIGSYGLRSNPMGSCTNPNPGSLFSPQGHAKGADAAIGSISDSMISLLTATNGSGSCYSTSQAWALSAPLFTLKASASPADNQGTPTFYCTDSSGAVTTLSSAITGPVCK